MSKILSKDGADAITWLLENHELKLSTINHPPVYYFTSLSGETIKFHIQEIITMYKQREHSKNVQIQQKTAYVSGKKGIQ